MVMDLFNFSKNNTEISTLGVVICNSLSYSNAQAQMSYGNGNWTISTKFQVVQSQILHFV